MPTEYRSANFYAQWYFRLADHSETGWSIQRTPDGQCLGDQDAFFWRAMEVINTEMNQIRSEEMKKAHQRGKR